MITDRPNNGTTDAGKSSRMGSNPSSSSTSSTDESRVSQLGHMAQEKLGEAASYVRDRGVSGLQTDLGDAVTRSPLRAVAFSVCIGYILGRLLSRK